MAKFEKIIGGGGGCGGRIGGGSHLNDSSGEGGLSGDCSGSGYDSSSNERGGGGGGCNSNNSGGSSGGGGNSGHGGGGGGDNSGSGSVCGGGNSARGGGSGGSVVGESGGRNLHDSSSGGGVGGGCSGIGGSGYGGSSSERGEGSGGGAGRSGGSSSGYRSGRGENGSDGGGSGSSEGGGGGGGVLGDKWEVWKKCKATGKRNTYGGYVVVMVIWFVLLQTVKPSLGFLSGVVEPELWVIWGSPFYIFPLLNIIIVIIAFRSGIFANTTSQNDGVDFYSEFVKKIAESRAKFDSADPVTGGAGKYGRSQSSNSKALKGSRSGKPLKTTWEGKFKGADLNLHLRKKY